MTEINTRARIEALLDHPMVERGLLLLILINAAILGAETYPPVMAKFGHALMAMDSLILGIFVVEIVLRIGTKGVSYFKDPWGVFDFTVVAIALAPATGPFAVLRSLRILRVLRLLTMIPSMRRVVGGLLGALPGLSSVIAVMGIIFYVCAVIATKLFGDMFPEWFGTLGASGYTLFQVMTLESWSMGIARPVIAQFPYAWIFFVIFILIATFTMLNLFIGVVVNAIQVEHDREQAEANEAIELRYMQQHEDTRQEIQALRAELQALLQQNKKPD